MASETTTVPVSTNEGETNVPVPAQVVEGAASETTDESQASVKKEDKSGARKEGVKVFVGNIPFKYKSKDLRALFGSEGILKSQVVSKGYRSSGYGFITFETAEIAEKSIEKLNGTDLEGRKISVEAAREPKKKAPVEKTEGDETEKPARKASRAPARKREPLTGTPSKTLLFVSNLPFSFTAESLKELFKSHDIATKTETIATRKYGQTAGRSKGFGFVDVEKEEDQQKAIEVLNDQEVEGRKIQVKVAIEREEKPATDVEQGDEAAAKAGESVADVATETEPTAA